MCESVSWRHRAILPSQSRGNPQIQEVFARIGIHRTSSNPFARSLRSLPPYRWIEIDADFDCIDNFRGVLHAGHLSGLTVQLSHVTDHSDGPVHHLLELTTTQTYRPRHASPLLRRGSRGDVLFLPCASCSFRRDRVLIACAALFITARGSFALWRPRRGRPQRSFAR